MEMNPQTIDVTKAPLVNNHNLDLADQVVFDIEKYFAQFPNASFALRFLAKESGICDRTIKRLLSKKNAPSHQTLYALYRQFLGVSTNQEVLELCPAVVRSNIEKYDPVLPQDQSPVSEKWHLRFKEEPLMAELLILAGTGPLHAQAVCYRYGAYGMELVEKLTQANFLSMISKDVYAPHPNAPRLDSESLKEIGMRLVQRFSKIKDAQVKDKNLLAFYAEGLNSEGLKRWIAIDTEAFYKKIEIAKNEEFRGALPVFTFMATDTLMKEGLGDTNE